MIRKYDVIKPSPGVSLVIASALISSLVSGCTWLGIGDDQAQIPKPDPKTGLHSRLHLELAEGATAQQGSFVFSASIEAPMKYEFSAPWRLTISDVKGVDVAERSFGKEQLDRSLPGFRVPYTRLVSASDALEELAGAADKAKSPPQSVSLTYVFSAFVCIDKTQCFIERHEGTRQLPL